MREEDWGGAFSSSPHFKAHTHIQNTKQCGNANTARVLSAERASLSETEIDLHPTSRKIMFFKDILITRFHPRGKSSPPSIPWFLS